MSGFYFGQEPFGGEGFQTPPTTFTTRVLSLDLDLEHGVTGGVMRSPRTVTIPAYSKTVTVASSATSVTLASSATSVTLPARRTSVTLPSRSTRIEDPDWLTSP